MQITQEWQHTLARTRLEEPIRFRNLELFPLLSHQPGTPDYLLLEEALTNGQARVTEISDVGSVPELYFENQGDLAVLLLDGEELVGAKQNRALNLSILAPAKQTLVIPVSCVEAGRWQDDAREFAAAPRAQYAAARAQRTYAVTQHLETDGVRYSDQHDVWADIAAKAARLEAASPSQAMSAMYDRHADTIEDFVRGLPVASEQCGALFAINGEVVGLDLFDFPETFRKLHAKLISSYALDALDAPQWSGPTQPTLSPDTAQGFLRSLAAAPATVFPAIGEGEDIRLKTPTLSGAALHARGRVIHLCAFALHHSGVRPERAVRTRMRHPSARARH